ncbi:GNAT family N-acetyltransferase [Lachnoclostridium phytofermentans]|uniref:N-acetyltransferase domain-containing protein n=1 Tax=Lachnoclostridium phytofermentans (strain ATCC 700394 / DSM 18823 / ISDg) TaxID=357809 RepID=A9KJ54_LACP7|nr:GNAT family N-acetyltransferase [Lachnoclostridium phytofermentans]ABX42466.1 conserved hypothetical protein [Lachnoclostridium phytofermentans ISDg]
MKNLGTVTIETKRLLLRPFRIEDANAMYTNWASDDDVTKYLMWPSHKSEEVSKEYIEYLIKNYENEEVYCWGIELKELHQLIGSISVVQQNPEIESAQIGYCIGKPWWKLGITTEAFRAIIQFLMDEVGINRIEARHDIKNISSGKVMEHCGLKLEGIHRQSDKNNQGICDAAWYALLREDYKRMI